MPISISHFSDAEKAELIALLSGKKPHARPLTPHHFHAKPLKVVKPYTFDKPPSHYYCPLCRRRLASQADLDRHSMPNTPHGKAVVEWPPALKSRFVTFRPRRRSAWSGLGNYLLEF